MTIARFPEAEQAYLKALEVGGAEVAEANFNLGVLYLRNMSRNVDIQPGDTLVTSGIDGLYPAGLPVAKVTQVDVYCRDGGIPFSDCTPHLRIFYSVPAGTPRG